MQETIIDLIRHGEPIGGTRLRGTQDDPLSELGWKQMRAAIGEHKPWQDIVSSPLLRCQNFAHELGDKLKLSVTLNDQFREIGFGEWEGMTTKELMVIDKEALQNYWQDPDRHTPAGGERMSDFVSRIHTAWETLVDNSDDQHRLLVCHGGVIRAILVKVLDMPLDKLWNFDVPYANISRIVYHRFPNGGQTAQLRFHQRQLQTFPFE